MCRLCNNKTDLSLHHRFLAAANFAGLEVAMKATDDFARNNILYRDSSGNAAPKGGPFGAQNYVMDTSTGQLIQAGDLCANAVVQTGIVSNHAEAMAMQPDQLIKWRDAILEVGINNAVMIQISSAESCPSCYAKQMIWHSRMASAGLIRAGNALTVFNATYDETLQKAGFNDLPYAIAALARSLDKTHPGLMVKTHEIDWRDIPKDVKESFLNYSHTSRAQSLPGMSVVYREATSKLRSLLTVANDVRPTDIFDYGDPFATSEVEAIRNKCKADRANGVFESWATPGSLYTMTSEIGPLMHAEAQWGSIGTIYSIKNAPESVQRIQPTQESASVSNDVFYQAATAGYNVTGADVKVLRLEVPNTAQPLWPKVLQEVMGATGQDAHYDGLDNAPDLRAVEPIYRERFTAPVAQELQIA